MALITTGGFGCCCFSDWLATTVPIDSDWIWSVGCLLLLLLMLLLLRSTGTTAAGTAAGATTFDFIRSAQMFFWGIGAGTGSTTFGEAGSCCCCSGFGASR